MFPAKTLARWAATTTLVGLLVLVMGCGGGGHSDPAPPTTTAPSITAQPQAVTVVSGQPASISVTATGSTPLSYQWRKDGNAITGSTAATFSITAAQVTDAGAYSVVVSNLGGSVTSTAAALAVNAPPTIGTQPVASQTVPAGGTVTFSVAATGNGTLSYQWTKGGTALTNGGIVSGATTSTLTLTGVQGTDAGDYACVVTNTLGITTTNATSGKGTLTVTSVPVVTHLSLAGYPASTTSGVSNTFTVTALDASNNTVPGYTGTVHFTSTDSAAVLPANYTFVPGDNGTHTFSATLTVAGGQTITATDLGNASVTGTQSGITVSASSATHISLSGFPATTNSGEVHGITLTAFDSANNVVTGYTGTIRFTSNDPQASLPSDYTFLAADAGTHAFSLHLDTAGTRSITATDMANASITGSQTGITVNPGTIDRFALSGFPGTTTAGEGQSMTITPLDPAGNVITGYTGTIHFTSTDLAAVLPADYTYTSGDNGSHTFSLTLRTAGTQNITVVDTARAAVQGYQGGITVNAAVVARFNLSGFPTSTSPGVLHTLTISAQDTFGNTVLGYTGTVVFTSSDASAILPSNYTFTSGDAGVHTFNVTLNSVGTQTISVTDTVSSALTGSLLGITVSATPPTITTQPQTLTVLPPDAVTFSVVAQANNGGSLTYAWKKNGTAIAGETGSSYTVPSTEFATNTDAYSVTVSEGALSTDSNTVYALASVPSPTYAGDPVSVPSRPITVLPSLHVDAVNFPNGAFRLGYDESLKDPVWSAYVNFPVNSPYANSTADYTADLRLAAPQVGKDDYTGIYTGGANYPDSYDRGHMTPRADVSYRYTTVAGDDATIMSNLVPQISQLNQQTWQKLEDAIGGTQGGTTNGLTSFKGRVWVYTGSVFSASPTWWNSTVTPGLKIAIPEGCYKIVVHETTPGHPEVLAVLMPNVWGLTNSTSTLTWYVTSVARIEALTGLNFFPNLAAIAPGLDIPTWKATVDVRGWQTPFEQATGPNVHMIQPSYDTAVDVGTTVTFDGAATPNSVAASGTTISGTTWNFGDATPTSTGFSTSHTFTASGSFNVTFTADDSLGSSNTITRVVRVIPPASGNTAPTTTPAVLADQITTVGQAVTATFTVADDRTLPGSVLVTAVSDNATLLPASGIVLTNSSGSVSLIMTPAAGQTGTATLTVTLTDGDGLAATRTFVLTVNAAASNVLTEGFEAGAKTAYATGSVAFTSGSWTLNDALVGTSTSDPKNGLKSVRVRNGIVTMAFDWSNGAQTVTVNHAKYGTDAASTWELYYSTDSGSTWTLAGPAVTSSTTTLTLATFTLNIPGPIRFEFRKFGGTTTRFNLDDFQINGY